MPVPKIAAASAATAALLLAASCTRHEINTTSEVKPIEIKPIHIIIDINVKVDKELDNFFGDLDKQAQQLAPKIEDKVKKQESN